MVKACLAQFLLKLDCSVSVSPSKGELTNLKGPFTKRLPSQAFKIKKNLMVAKGDTLKSLLKNNKGFTTIMSTKDLMRGILEDILNLNLEPSQGFQSMKYFKMRPAGIIYVLQCKYSKIGLKVNRSETFLSLS